MPPLSKIPTGIGGFDELSHGGLPQHRVTLLKGGPHPSRPKKQAKNNRAGPALTAVVVLRLYIAEGAPNSVRAVANLEAICKRYLRDSFKLEIIDVLEFPLRALADGIVVTPSLAKIAPSPGAKIVGNLSDRGNVLHALGIKE